MRFYCYLQEKCLLENMCPLLLSLQCLPWLIEETEMLLGKLCGLNRRAMGSHGQGCEGPVRGMPASLSSGALRKGHMRAQGWSWNTWV